MLTLPLVASIALKGRSLDTFFLGIATVMVLPDSMVPAGGYASLMAKGVIAGALMAPVLRVPAFWAVACLFLFSIALSV